MSDRVIPLRDGRRLGVNGLGDPAAGRVVVVCHPAPGAGAFDPDPAVTSSWGVHLVAPDRPGYGSSTALPLGVRPLIGHRADEIAEMLGRMIEHAEQSGRAPFRRVGVVGWSAGGRVALALAARHPGLVDRVAVVAAPAPDSAVGWVPDRLREVNAELLRLPVPEAKERLRGLLAEQAPTGTAGVEVLANGEADASALERPGLRGRVERMLTQAYEQGTAGVADDVLSYAGDDWGFDLHRVEASTLLVYGAQDPVAPSAHGRWYRRHLPHAHLSVVPRSGHLVIATAWRAVLEHVDPHRAAF